MDAPSEALAPVGAAARSSTDLEATFHANYDRIARVIARVIRDPARAEELAVDIFLKWARVPPAHDENAAGWFHRAAVRVALDELRRRARRARYERLVSWLRGVPSPEDLFVAREASARVRVVLAALPTRQAELLLLRSHGLSYDELASTLRVSAASVGTLLARAQRAFRKEFVTRYGETK